ncbi:MAG: F0F1 ATP synthase subunit epsilon [Candidatus Subteraquimicrobiales bacterium]|nr:F0F1 ATP synthase subunit epsilon [Candidatus Subteraquimicrobiales bacterium]
MDKIVSCEVITPEGLVYSGEVNMVVVPGEVGEIGVLPLHAPLIATLDVGEMRVKIDEKWDYIAVYRGYMEVREDKVIVLADAAEIASRVDVEKVKLAKEKAEKALEEAAAEEDFFEAQKELTWALTRLRVAGKAK